MKCHDPCPYTISYDICSRCKLRRSARRYVDATSQECCSIYFSTEDGGSRFLPHKHGSKAHTSSGDPARGSNDRRVERDLQRFVGRQPQPSRPGNWCAACEAPASSAFGCQVLVLSFPAVLLPLGAPSILYTHTHVHLVACICKPSGVRMTRLQFAAICSCSPPHDVKGVTGCCSIRPPRFNPSQLKPQH